MGWTDNTAASGVIVNGDDVTAYGLFVEHNQEYEVVWNGDRGTDFFFLNEMPYDRPARRRGWKLQVSTAGRPSRQATA